MDNIYLLMLIALAVLAIADLVVGVSNDAVNFLNSAIGSKAISFRAIMIVASIGVALGAIFSSGMMEVARKGIFIPGEFYFSEIMIIFMAVMITDILLLDFFNTLGLPTSTTVSIVFELLGAAVAISLIKIISNDGSVTELANYINTSKATEIILGIVGSVIIAFSIGAFVQYMSRLLLSFNFERKSNFTRALFGGIALTAITYFIFIKGLKGTDYYKAISHLIEGKTLIIIFISLIFWTFFSYLFVTFIKKNIYKLIIGVGTFALALAFAGNDLVNFIGVPIAAWQSYEAWAASGIPANEFTMETLGGKVSTPTLLLFLSGLIMVVTLWFSKKARYVAETEINLAREGAGKERFEPNFLSRALVRGSILASRFAIKVMPKSIHQKIEKQFEKPVIKLAKGKRHELPAFDMVRAAVNLMTASVLISWATSMKLPLSTTYVTFMVAMGTSLADRAWGTDSAVYRVAGVLNVIGGWFFTAISAFIAAGIVAYLIDLGGATMIAILLLMAVILLIRNYLQHIKRNRELKAEDSLSKAESSSIQGVIEESADTISKVLKRLNKVNSHTVQGLINEDLSSLKKAKKSVVKLENEIDDLQSHIFYFIKDLDDSYVGASKFYIDLIGSLQDMAQSASFIAKVSHKHIYNNHKTLKKKQAEELTIINDKLSDLFFRIRKIFENRDFDKIVPDLMDEKITLLSQVEQSIQYQVERTRTAEANPKNTTLFFSILLESKDLIKAVMNVLDLYYIEHDRTENMIENLED
ncbi:MAG: phosphate:sodium symporter [Flavobacteriales bacterium]|nr:MAG: phosphate:sodium symporter [Flavobacteriales bacterium]